MLNQLQLESWGEQTYFGILLLIPIFILQGLKEMKTVQMGTEYPQPPPPTQAGVRFDQSVFESDPRLVLVEGLVWQPQQFWKLPTEAAGGQMVDRAGGGRGGVGGVP